jgi:hypothetical protein
MYKNIVLFITLFSFPAIKSQAFITEIINNTNTIISIKSPPTSQAMANGHNQPIDYKMDFLVSESIGSKVLEKSCQISPHSRHIVDGLIIPSVNQNSADNSIGLYMAAKFSWEPFLLLGRVGDLLSIVDMHPVVKQLNFMNEKYTGKGIVGDYISKDVNTYTLEINELKPSLAVVGSRAITRSVFPYEAGSLEINLKPNSIDASKVKSELKKQSPVARITAYGEDKRPITVLIEFDKIVTDYFRRNFIEQLGKRIDLNGAGIPHTDLKDGKSAMNFIFYRKVTQAELQAAIDAVNRLKLSEYAN